MSYDLQQELPEYQYEIERLNQSDQMFSQLLTQYYDVDLQIKLLVLASENPDRSLRGLTEQRLTLKTALIRYLNHQ